MKEIVDIEARKPIWLALSDFYLDTELHESCFRHLALKILESPYSFEKIREIDQYEVFPVLQPNLMSSAGEWAGFDKEWLIHRITESLAKRKWYTKILVENLYPTFKGIGSGNWKSLEEIYWEVKSGH
ncbi:hypothetical protein CLV98_113104 [Dyadobacter jejuensis]|uniref:DUF7079 domain-containing protein n=1 Tax=Dyadobacter jejuensis TaxID=1082580 RepID=A0A316AEC8_9BACT|nr:hypothetical protein [Dyadobacter jejuensis]PWJ55628.1 hypothetical protein CLV98_113104 [Dyadobacter jejuensis]